MRFTVRRVREVSEGVGNRTRFPPPLTKKQTHTSFSREVIPLGHHRTKKGRKRIMLPSTKRIIFLDRSTGAL